MKDIRFENVTKSFPTRSGTPFVAIHDVSLAVAEREFVAVVGPSGSGKTTLMRMAAGLDHPSAGSVRVGGREVTAPGPDRAVVFQQFALFPWKSVRENIAFGLRCKGVPRARQDEIVAHYLRLMSMEGTEDRFPHQLSGGMQQRVAIARSYAIEPDVLLMDEPLGALDKQLRRSVQLEIRRLHEEHRRTTIYVTHDQEEALVLSDRVAVMRDGRIEQVGTADDLYDRPVSAFVAGFIGESNLLPAKVGGLDGDEAKVDVAALGHSVVAAAAPGLRPGQGCRLLIRPEHVLVGGAGETEAVIQEVVYLGELTALHLRLESGSDIWARQITDRNVRRGDRVQVGWKRGAARVVPDV